MKTRLHAALFSCALLLACLRFCGCTTTQTGILARSPDVPPSPGILRVGITPDSPPLISKQGGEIKGLDADFARGLAASMNRQVVFIEDSWEDLIPSLLNNRTDIIMSGMSVTGARQFRVNFTQPYLQVGQMALIRAADAREFGYAITMKNRRVGVMRGTTGDLFVQKTFTTVRRIPYASVEAAAEALIDNKIDLFIHDAPSIWWLASTYEARGLTYKDQFLNRENLAWAVRKDDPATLRAANEYQDELRRSGKMDQIIRTWIPLTP